MPDVCTDLERGERECELLSSEMKYLHPFISPGGKCEEFKVNLNASPDIDYKRATSINLSTRLCFTLARQWCKRVALTCKIALSPSRVVYYITAQFAVENGLWIDVNAISHTASVRREDRLNEMDKI